MSVQKVVPAGDGDGDGGAADASLASLLRALRSRLQAKVEGDGGDTSGGGSGRCIYRPESEAGAPSTNDLLSSIAGSDPTLQASIQRHVRASAHSARVDALRRRRRELRALRVAHEAARDQQKRTVEREAAKVRAVVERQRLAFGRYVHQQESAATQRLQMLFFECVAEMKKAVVRLDGVAADALEETASMMDARERRFRWQLFLTRLEEDFHSCGVSSSILHPPSSTVTESPHPSCDGSSAALCSALDAVMQTHGPSIPSDRCLRILSVLSVRRGVCSPGQLSPGKSKRPQASLHFDESAGEAWNRITNDLQQFYRDQRAATKPAPSSARSTRRIRRLPAPSQQRSAPERALYQTQHQSSWTRVRHLVVSETPQFTAIECDVPLSASFIHWLTPSASQRCKPCGRDDHFDCSVYFDLGEYHRKFSASLQSTESTDHDAGVSDMSVLSSVRSALKDVNDILDTYRATLQAGRPVSEMMAAFPGALLLSQCEVQAGDAAESRHRVFVRASVLQLVQTGYYSERFLPQFPPQDRQALQQLYPPSFTGADFLSALYIARTGTSESEGSCTGDQGGPSDLPGDRSKPIMETLSDAALHELMLIYIARARQLDGQPAVGKKDKASDVLVSMAQSDATHALLSRLPELPSDSETRFCIVKNPRGVLRTVESQKHTHEQLNSSLVQTAADADYLFVEFSITRRESGNQLTAARPPTASPRQALELLGSSCQWRSCLDQADDNADASAQSNRVCAWHNTLKLFLGNDEGCQYLPNLSGIQSLLGDSALSRVGSAKRAILRSSSLVEEVASRQLCHSLRAFFDHVRASMTSKEFLKTHWAIKDSSSPAVMSPLQTESNGSVEEQFRVLQSALEVTREVLLTERRATLALHNLRKLVARNQPHAALGPSNVLDIAELNRDIRTTDLELVLQLSGQKLQRLQQLCRAEEEESQAAAAQFQHDNNPSCDESIDTSSPVFDVVHVLRKGRRSLQRKQQQQHQPPSRRPQSAARRTDADASSCKALQRVASDFDQQRRAGRFEKTMS